MQKNTTSHRSPRRQNGAPDRPGPARDAAALPRPPLWVVAVAASTHSGWAGVAPTAPTSIIRGSAASPRAGQASASGPAVRSTSAGPVARPLPLDQPHPTSPPIGALGFSPQHWTRLRLAVQVARPHTTRARALPLGALSRRFAPFGHRSPPLPSGAPAVFAARRRSGSVARRVQRLRWAHTRRSLHSTGRSARS